MAINLAETIQQNLGYPALQPVSPNTQDIEPAYQTPQQLLTQASVTTVLAGLYRYTKNIDGLHKIFTETTNNVLLSVFANNEHEVLDALAKYTNAPHESVVTTLTNAATQAIKIIREQTGNTTDSIRQLLTDQRHNILKYLPAPLNMGAILNDDTLDDRTNKMEGPISSLLHKIEEAFGGGNPSK